MGTKPTGELGITHLGVAEDGSMVAALEPLVLPKIKEELEKIFADAFIALSNKEQLLGAGIYITDSSQNDTSTLDFDIVCPVAKHLELAEITPRSEPFGQEAMQTGELPIFEFAEWIWSEIIYSKQDHYIELGRDVDNTILLLYGTYWQFMPNDEVIETLRARIYHIPPRFQSVFLLWGNPKHLHQVKQIYPWSPPPYAKEEWVPIQMYRGLYYRNYPPGAHIFGNTTLSLANEKGERIPGEGMILYAPKSLPYVKPRHSLGYRMLHAPMGHLVHAF